MQIEENAIEQFLAEINAEKYDDKVESIFMKHFHQENFSDSQYRLLHSKVILLAYKVLFERLVKLNQFNDFKPSFDNIVSEIASRADALKGEELATSDKLLISLVKHSPIEESTSAVNLEHEDVAAIYRQLLLISRLQPEYISPKIDLTGELYKKFVINYQQVMDKAGSEEPIAASSSSAASSSQSSRNEKQEPNEEAIRAYQEQIALRHLILSKQGTGELPSNDKTVNYLFTKNENAMRSANQNFNHLSRYVKEDVTLDIVQRIQALDEETLERFRQLRNHEKNLATQLGNTQRKNTLKELEQTRNYMQSMEEMKKEYPLISEWVKIKDKLQESSDNKVRLNSKTTGLIDEYDDVYKIVLAGDNGVGKTNLVSRFAGNAFEEHVDPRIGVEFSTRTIVLDEKMILLQAWDQGHEQRSRLNAGNPYLQAAAVLLCFDVTNPKTLQNLSVWHSEVKNNASSTIKFIVVGTKIDIGEERKVSYEEALKFAQKINAIYIETSAKDNINVEKLFVQAAACIKNGQSQVYPEKKSPVEPTELPTVSASSSLSFFGKLQKWFTGSDSDKDDTPKYR